MEEDDLSAADRSRQKGGGGPGGRPTDTGKGGPQPERSGDGSPRRPNGRRYKKMFCPAADRSAAKGSWHFILADYPVSAADELHPLSGIIQRKLCLLHSAMNDERRAVQFDKVEFRQGRNNLLVVFMEDLEKLLI